MCMDCWMLLPVACLRQLLARFLQFGEAPKPLSVVRVIFAVVAPSGIEGCRWRTVHQASLSLIRQWISWCGCTYHSLPIIHPPPPILHTTLCPKWRGAVLQDSQTTLRNTYSVHMYLRHCCAYHGAFERVKPNTCVRTLGLKRGEGIWTY